MSQLNQDPPRIEFDEAIKRALPTPVASLIVPPAKKILALDRLNSILAALPHGQDMVAVLGRVLEEVGVGYDLPDEDLARFPAKGPVAVVANHPFGMIEGVLLGHILRRVRPDVKFMANYILGRIPGLSDLFTYVDPFEVPSAKRTNMRPLRESLRYMKSGGAMVFFPAGEVASLQLQSRTITDPEWSPTVAGLIRRSGASVMPAYFAGANSRLFQILGLVHPRLRTVMLPRELLKQADKTISIRFGEVLEPDKLADFDDLEMMAYLRARVYMLGEPKAKKNRKWRLPANLPGLGGGVKMKPIAPAQDMGPVRDEVARLPGGQILTDRGQFLVFHARAEQIPKLLREIGREREITFRKAGEGTGRPLDLDRFDRYYTHLVLWDQDAGRLAGAYRAARVDRVLDRYGPPGLYTATLFKYRASYLKRISPAMELGRSFIAADYQRSYSGLMLLWKGIGQLVLSDPDIRYLFGPVSIDERYHPLSRRLMMEFLQDNFFEPGLARLVKPRTPAKLKDKTGIDARTLAATAEGIEDLSSMVADLEEAKGEGRAGVPVLLRQYLKLGGLLLGFNVDPAFGNAIDGLILIDLMGTDQAIMKRYMGKEAYLGYREHQLSLGRKPHRKAAAL